MGQEKSEAGNGKVSSRHYSSEVLGEPSNQNTVISSKMALGAAVKGLYTV